MGLKATNYLEAMNMVEKCRNQRKLAKIAETTKFGNVWEAAVDKITDQKILYRLSLNQENISAACLATRKLTDQNQIAEIAANGQLDQDLRRIAIEHLIDQNLVEQIARSEPNDRIRGTALACLSNPSLQAQLAANDLSRENRRWAASTLNDQGMLIYLASNDSEADVRQIAISRISDDMTRARLALWDKAAKIEDREQALELLKPDEATLEKLIVQYDNYGFSGAALPLIHDEDRLMRIAQARIFASDAAIRRITDRKKLLFLAADPETVFPAVEQIQKLKMLDEEAIGHVHSSYPEENLKFEWEIAAFLRRLEDASEGISKGSEVVDAFLHQDVDQLATLATPEAVEALVLLLRAERFGRGRYRIGSLCVTPLGERIIPALRQLWKAGNTELRQSIRKANGISFPQHHDNGAKSLSCHWDVAPVTLNFEY